MPEPRLIQVSDLIVGGLVQLGRAERQSGDAPSLGNALESNLYGCDPKSAGSSSRWASDRNRGTCTPLANQKYLRFHQGYPRHWQRTSDGDLVTYGDTSTYATDDMVATWLVVAMVLKHAQEVTMLETCCRKYLNFLQSCGAWMAPRTDCRQGARFVSVGCSARPPLLSSTVLSLRTCISVFLDLRA